MLWVKIPIFHSMKDMFPSLELKPDLEAGGDMAWSQSWTLVSISLNFAPSVPHLLHPSPSPTCCFNFSPISSPPLLSSSLCCSRLLQGWEKRGSGTHAISSSCDSFSWQLMPFVKADIQMPFQACLSGFFGGLWALEINNFLMCVMHSLADVFHSSLVSIPIA